MRFVLALLLLATTVSATTFFDPPNPTSATPVVAHVMLPPAYCTPRHGDFLRNGSNISVAVRLDSPCVLGQLAPNDFPVSLGTLPPGVYNVVADGVVTGSPDRIPAIDRGTLVVRDAAPSFDVVPNVVPASGGAIRLRGSGIVACPVPLPLICNPLPVKIDGQPVAATLVSSNEVAVTVPPHAAGPVDVAVDTLTATAALDYFELDKTPEPAFFEPVIFPALVTGPGAFGSQWTTDVALHNGNGDALPVASSFFGSLSLFGSLPAASDFVITQANAPAGMLLYAARQGAPGFFVDVLARDLSRQSEALGTEIPVAREKDLYDRKLHILLVPTDSKYRVALRLFRTDGAPAVAIAVFSRSGAFIDFDQVPLSPASPATPMFMSATIPDLVQRFPRIAGQGPLRIEIGAPSSRSTWALVSVTNNETQHVTVIAPH